MNLRTLFAADLPDALVEKIPELMQPMAKEASFWKAYGVSKLGPDTAFSLVLAPFVIEQVSHENEGRAEVLERIFQFLEELTYSTDDGVLSALDVSFGEELLADIKAFKRAKKYMGRRLRETLEEKQSLLASLPKTR